MLLVSLEKNTNTWKVEEHVRSVKKTIDNNSVIPTNILCPSRFHVFVIQGHMHHFLFVNYTAPEVLARYGLKD